MHETLLKKMHKTKIEENIVNYVSLKADLVKINSKCINMVTNIFVKNI